MHRNRSAFTLIELLIVVAIIAILAAIAVPNFLEAQVRSKVSRMKADLRTLTTAVESYMVDHNKYPPAPAPWPPDFIPTKEAKTWLLTTPVAYINSIPKDVFSPDNVRHSAAGGPFDIRGKYLKYITEIQGEHWLAFSNGPDLVFSPGPPPTYSGVIYDATNGSISDGDIYYLGSPD